MQHLLTPLHAAVNSKTYSRLDLKTAQLIEQYLRTGDEKLVPMLKAVPDQTLWSLSKFAEAVPTPDQWTQEDRRALHFLIFHVDALGLAKKAGGWDSGASMLINVIERTLEKEGPAEDTFAMFQEEFSRLKVKRAQVIAFTARSVHPLARDGKLTSAGRFLVALPPADLAREMEGVRGNHSREEFFAVWLAGQPAHLVAVAEALVKAGTPDFMVEDGWQLLLAQNPKEREELCVGAFRSHPWATVKFELGCQLAGLFPGKYEDEVWKAAPKALEAHNDDDGPASVARWMLAQRGAEAIPHLRDYIAGWNLGNQYIQSWKIAVMEEATKALGAEARPVVLAGLQADMPQLRRASISSLMGFRDPAEEEEIVSLLETEFKSKDSEDVAAAVPLAASWNCPRLAPRMWELLAHKSKPVREAAVGGLANLGEAAVSKALELLAARKSETRAAAAALLGRIGSVPAVEALRKALEAEQSDTVADAMRSALGAATGAVGQGGAEPEVSRASIEATIRKASAKTKMPATWLDPQKLPALQDKEGKGLDADAVRYLLFRQSRNKNVEPDAEARPLYGLIDRASSGDFALTIYNGFISSGADAGDRWALTVAGLLGDERIVPLLARQIEEWADSSRGKLAEYGVQALALQASDPALLSVDALAIRYRTKNKNIGKAAAEAFGKAAEARGLSPAELGDRVIPWLGFAPGQPRLLSWGGAQFEVTIGLDFKPAYRDVAKNKRVTSLPGSAPAEVKTQTKELSAALKEAVKAQLLRLENLMVQQHRWPAARWAELFLQHPLLLPFAVRLVWGAYDDTGKLTATFRALEDRTLTTASDDPAATPASGTVGIVHPLELEADVRQAWLQHCADYEIVPPFPQLERAVIRPAADQLNRKIFDEVNNTELNAMTFRGRAEKRGWVRGSVVDAGGVNYYYKPFAAAGVDVFVALDGMYVGIDMYSSITLGTFYFVRNDSVKVGSYTYDEPSGDKDPRLITAGEVPPIAYSEALGDLRQIAGKAAANDE